MSSTEPNGAVVSAGGWNEAKQRWQPVGPVIAEYLAEYLADDLRRSFAPEMWSAMGVGPPVDTTPNA